MSILIKGMDMPKNCAECKVYDVARCGTNYKYLLEHVAYYDFVRPDCPLIELPPHGRLIDADALDKHIYNDVPLKVFGNIARMADMRILIDDAPTIIEAEE